MNATSTLEALATGRLSGAALLGLDATALDALVAQALRQAEHGQVDEALELMRALATVQPERGLLALLVGHLEVERGQPRQGLVAYAEAARRLEAASEAPGPLAADVELARAEVELSLDLEAPARARLAWVRAHGSDAARARAEALARGVQ